MKDFFVTCPWCKSRFYEPRLSNCTNCGGALPISEDGDAGAPPPPTPRVLPKSFVRSTKYFNNVYTMIGVIFTIPFCWTIIFPIIGIIMWKKGIREANEELLPLQEGAHAKGEITNIYYDRSKSINGRNPKVVEFVFETGGRKYGGNVPNIMDPIDVWKKPGDKIWVVFLRENPDISSVWPPIK